MGLNGVYYIFYYVVVRWDKLIIKLCIYVGFIFTLDIFDIMLRFRSYRVVFVWDIEKVFLMVYIVEVY